jgi:hypothetical protein
MTDYLIDPPIAKLLPLTKGADRAFSVQRVHPTTGDPLNYDAGTVSMWIDIDPAAPTEVQATISGAVASIRIPSTVCDLAPSGTRWRIVWTDGTDDTPIVVGRVKRHDG